jgi:DNA-binding response OmpR family regulator
VALSGATTVRSHVHAAAPRAVEHRRWLSWGDHLSVWPGRRLVRVGRRIANLTRGEFVLLEMLAREDGEPVSRAELVRAIRRGATSTSSRTVDTHIHTLRRKLGDDSRDPRLIVTVSGVGYALAV